MASLLKLMSSNILSIANRGLILQVPNFAHNQIANVSKTTKILEKLGISAVPPKPPKNGYLRFAEENRDSLKASTKSQTELFSLLATRWKQLSDEQKEKYNKEYKKEQSEYRKRRLEYLSKLTPEQKKAIKAERKSLKESESLAAKKKILKNELSELGKPKKPSSAMALFVLDQSKLNPQFKPRDHLKDSWAKLSEAEKQAYKQKAQQLLDAYEGELSAWEDKMMREQKAHLVRKKRFLTKKTEEVKRVQKPKTE